MDVWYHLYYSKLNNFSALTCKDVGSHHYYPHNNNKKAKQTVRSVIFLRSIKRIEVTVQTNAPKTQGTGKYTESQLTGSRSPRIQEFPDSGMDRKT